MKIKNNFSRVLCLVVSVMMGTTAAFAATQYNLARWSFNYKYTIAGGQGTPTSTAQSGNDNTNLHDVQLLPNESLLSDFYLLAHRPTSGKYVASQDSKGAYLETQAISCDGAALHMTSPVPTPETESTSYTWGSTSTAFPDGKSYSYQNPYSYFEIKVNTKNYKNIQLVLKAAGHNSSAQYYAVAYSTDKTTWTVAGDSYLTGKSYNKWVTTTVKLPDLADLDEAYIRVFPAKNWKGATDKVNSDNQFDLDDVYVKGELTVNLAQISKITVNGSSVTTVSGQDYDYDYKLAKDYSDNTVTITPVIEYADATVTAVNDDGENVDITANEDGSYTVPTPDHNKFDIITFRITPQDGATAHKTEYRLRLFRLGDTYLTSVTLDGTAIADEVLATLNSQKENTLTGQIYTHLPVLATEVIDGSEATVKSSLDGNVAKYVITAGDAVFTLNVEGVHVYTRTSADEDVTLLYSGDGKSAYTAEGTWTDGWTDGMYTLRTTGLDGWGGAQFKFNGSEFKFEVPGGVVVKTFSFEKFGANYGDGDGITAFASDGADCWVPTLHSYKKGATDTVTVVIDNHKAGEPLTFSITGGGQPYALFHLVVEKTNPGTAPQVTNKKATVVNNHAVVAVSFDREMNYTTTTFNGQELNSEGGVTLTFGITDLEYGKTYDFTLPAGSVSDIFGNTNAEDIVVSFTVGERQAVKKKAYDYVVGSAAEFSAALKKIGSSSSTSLERVTIFMKNGDYDFGEDNEQRINRGNVSVIGQSRDGVVIHGTRTGISNPILNIRDRQGFYLQDLTVRNDLDFGTARKGVGVAIYGGNKTIMKNVCMQSQQDTQVTGERSYFDHCKIHGTVDFICGGGNQFYDQCDIILEASGSVITAPATAATLRYGYVFSHCTISPAEGLAMRNKQYTLARPWQNEPRTYFLYTRMNVLPTDNGYRNMSSLVTHFYEYGSVDKNGNTVDLSVRGNSSSSTNHYTPVISEQEAKTYTVINVLGESDAWLPTDYTKLTAAPQATVESGTISWTDDDQVRCYVIFKDDVYVADVTGTSYTPEEDGIYTIRTANEMGGLSEESTTVTVNASGIREIKAQDNIDGRTFNLAGQSVGRNYKGLVVTGGKKYIR